jgi:hypothetical protein
VRGGGVDERGEPGKLGVAAHGGPRVTGRIFLHPFAIPVPCKELPCRSGLCRSAVQSCVGYPPGPQVPMIGRYQAEHVLRKDST